ncbi:MAG: mechanosensitive ion channel [Cyanophyceae cyanobacterium]
MNDWQIKILSGGISSLPIVLAQEAVPDAQNIPEPGPGFFQELGRNLTGFLPTIIAAIVILVVGIIIAYIVKAIVRGILNSTNIDNRIANWISGRPDTDAPKVEDWISSAFFWLVVILTIVAVLQTLQLDAVTQPINDFLSGVIGFLPNIVGALILLGVAWLLATVVKLVVTRALKAFGLDERLGQQMEDPETATGTTRTTGTTVSSTTTTRFADESSSTESTGTTARTSDRPSASNQFSLSETIGNALYWFIFLLFLPSILSTLGLEGTLAPVQELLNEILAILPNILAAIVIAGAGWLVAQIVRRIVTNLLAAAGTDRLGARFGFSTRPGNQSLSWLLGTIVFVLILIPTAIAALQALQIEAISEPAIAMLNEILNFLPNLFAAAVILALAYVAGHFVSELLTNILTSVGFNRVFQWLGFPTRPASTTPPQPPPATAPEMADPTSPRPTPSVPSRSPSELVGIIAWVGIVLFGTLAAVNIIDIPALTALVSGIVLISGQILAGLIVFAIGLYLANLAFNLIISSGSRQSRILAQTARIAIIALVSAMALQQMGIASNIVNLAFGLLFGAVAVAIALAFGLGSRDIAANQVREWLDSFKRQP